MRIFRLALAAILASGTALAGEDTDFGVAATRALRLTDYAAPTPREVPGARVVRTPQVKEWLQRDAAARPLLIDVVGGTGHDSLPGALWLPGAGRGNSFSDELQGWFKNTLATLTQGNRARLLVFYCASELCWLSYNAALRAVAIGYPEVYWYRGGIDAWIEGGGELAPVRPLWPMPAK